MQPTVTVDPTIYGGQPVSTADVPVIDPNSFGNGGPAQQASVDPVRVDQSAIAAGSSAVAEGQAAIAAANRPQATAEQSALAAIKTWTTTRALESLSAPSFAKDQTFDPKPLINLAPIQLGENEQKWLAQSNSQDEYNYRLDQVKQQADLYTQMGDHPYLSMLVGAVDPVYLGIDIASAGIAGAATSAFALGRGAGRVAAGLGSVAGNYAVGEAAQKVAPISDAEVLGMALINGAAAAAVFHVPSGRFVKKDPTYPSDQLGQAAAGLSEQGVGIEQRVVAESADAVRDMSARPPVSDEALAKVGLHNVQPRADATDAYTALAAHEADPTYGPVIKALREEQPDALAQVPIREADHVSGDSGYVHQDGTIYMDRTKANDPMTLLHETIHGLTSQKLAYGLENPGTAHGALVQQLEQIRQTARLHADASGVAQDSLSKYLRGNVQEFVAGLFSGDSAFAQHLASIPTTGAPNLLSKLTNAVRKLLGIAPDAQNALNKALGLTDELMKMKLTSKLPEGVTINHAPNIPSMTGTPVQNMQKLRSFWDKQAQGESGTLGVARAGEWSLSRSMKKGSEGDRVSRLLVDDPIDMTADSAASQRQAIRSDMATHQYAYEDGIRAELSNRGIGLRQRIFQSGRAQAEQAHLERQVYDELMRRDNAVRRGAQVVDPNVDPAITRLADAHDRATQAALQEMKASGVLGADAVDIKAGYASRKWDNTKLEAMEAELERMGMTNRQARAHVRNAIADAIERAQPTIKRDMAEDIAQAITTRTRNKGYFEDAVDMGRMGDDGAQGIRSILQGSGLSPDRMQRIEEFLTGRKDDAGMLSSLKHRVEMDMQTPVVMPDGTTRSLTDLVDTNTTRNLDGYLDDAAGQAALARKGLTNQSEITALRSSYLHGIEDEAVRKEAATLFDNTIKTLKGQPVGEEVNAGWRRLQAVTTSVGLANSGLWQVMEYANIAAKYGLVKTAREVLSQLPIARALVGEAASSTQDARSLANVLARNSYQDMRIRPMLNKLEDNFTIPVSDTLTLALQQTKQLVPYINAMRFVHHSQANVTANLILDTIQRAVGGDARAAEALAKYGLEGQQLAILAREDLTKSIDTWSNDAWAQVRGPLGKMMDDAVLRNRTGEIPAFAQYSTLGKFIFTYRSFVLGAHNKVLLGTLGRHGLAGLGLLMAYQFPLAMASSFAVSAARGQPITDPQKLASTALQQMSAMGLFSELFGIAAGDKQQFGAPGLMAIDRLYKTGAQLGQGNFGKAANGLAQSIPLLAIMPGIKALGEQATK